MKLEGRGGESGMGWEGMGDGKAGRGWDGREWEEKGDFPSH